MPGPIKKVVKPVVSVWCFWAINAKTAQCLLLVAKLSPLTATWQPVWHSVIVMANDKNTMAQCTRLFVFFRISQSCHCWGKSPLYSSTSSRWKPLSILKTEKKTSRQSKCNLLFSPPYFMLHLARSLRNKSPTSNTVCNEISLCHLEGYISPYLSSLSGCVAVLWPLQIDHGKTEKKKSCVYEMIKCGKILSVPSLRAYMILCSKGKAYYKMRKEKQSLLEFLTGSTCSLEELP